MVTYLDSLIILNGMQETTMYLFNTVDDYFGSPGKGTFDETVFYRLCKNFLNSWHKLSDEIAEEQYDLKEVEVPFTMQ